VRLLEPAPRVRPAELDQRLRELRREQQEAQQLGVLHVGAGPGDPPFTVKGERLDDGSIKASVEAIDGKAIPFAEFTGRR
jgi:hypothetical protein